MTEWKFLARHAITTYPGNRPCEYVAVGKNIVGYAEQDQSGTWTYYQFGTPEKGNTTPPDSIAKETGKTAFEAARSSLS